MAGTAVTKIGESLGGGGSEVDSIRLSLNKLVDDVELVRAALVLVATRLDADAGVTGTTFVSSDCAACNIAAEVTGYKVNR